LKSNHDCVDVKIRQPFDRLEFGFMNPDQLVFIGKQVSHEVAPLVRIQLVVDGAQQGVTEPEDVVAGVKLLKRWRNSPDQFGLLT
jgi:hypothetical protein